MTLICRNIRAYFLPKKLSEEKSCPILRKLVISEVIRIIILLILFHIKFLIEAETSVVNKDQ